MFFFFEVDRFPVTGFRLDLRLKSGYYSGGEGGGTYKATISANINPWRVKLHAEQLHAHNRAVVEFLVQEKQMLFNQELRF